MTGDKQPLPRKSPQPEGVSGLGPSSLQSGLSWKTVLRLLLAANPSPCLPCRSGATGATAMTALSPFLLSTPHTLLPAPFPVPRACC